MNKLHIAGIALVTSFALAACGDPGPGEQAGEGDQQAGRGRIQRRPIPPRGPFGFLYKAF